LREPLRTAHLRTEARDKRFVFTRVASPHCIAPLLRTPDNNKAEFIAIDQPKSVAQAKAMEKLKSAKGVKRMHRGVRSTLVVPVSRGNDNDLGMPRFCTRSRGNYCGVPVRLSGNPGGAFFVLFEKIHCLVRGIM
jgi:hypothetical protein